MDNQPFGLSRYVSVFMGPSNSAEMTSSLPSVFCANDVSLESGANAGCGGVAEASGGLRTEGGSRAVIDMKRGPLTKEYDSPCREAETRRPVVLLICSDRAPAVAVRNWTSSVTAGFVLPTD